MFYFPSESLQASLHHQLIFSSRMQNLQPCGEALGTVLGHAALQESRSSQGEGWSKHLVGQSVRRTASKGLSWAVGFGHRS